MRSGVLAAAAGVAILGALAGAQGARQRLNPMIDLLEQKKPIFGRYAPANRGGGPAATPAPAARTAAELAKEALAYDATDFIFSGSMERGLDRGLPAFAEFAAAVSEAGALIRTPSLRLRHPLVVKTPRIAPDPAKAIDNISRQLNLGVSTIVFVDVESGDELRQGIAAMRFKSRGGTRPDGVGTAPEYWGMTEPQYREKADLWPLNPSGELVSWAIVESKQGLAKVREIAAVKGLAVLFPGAGTLRGVFTTTGADRQRAFDAAAWEAAIQQVLAACKEFNVPCGYPATADDIEMRMKQGFSVFIMSWGPGGFKAVENRPQGIRTITT